ncbi:anthranilate phosphoribosyltransferase [Brochothrix thermosphacta DSM 20171 = FSL F6-1036]|nr:anthranilate phosphoribosyltransferase [Brochothrix thermosphacta DSM 20171 = FSL F6-1036]
MLAGEKGAYREAVVLNSAIGLVAAQRADSFEEAILLAEAAIDSNEALEHLHYLQKTTGAD